MKAPRARWISPGVGAWIALSAAFADEQAFRFRDVGEDAGLFPTLAGIQGHGAAWGDVDGDGFLDLYVGTFHKGGTGPNVLLRGSGGKFRADSAEVPRISQRATGMVCADFDNDGDLDLYIASMPQPKNALRGCALLRNEGGGSFVDVSAENGACPPAFGGRGVAVADFDGDGLLDLLVGEDPVPGYNGSPTKSTRLFRNVGALQFTDVSREAGLPADMAGLGVAFADVNSDGWPDFFIASAVGGNVLFLNDGRGRFREAPGSRETFQWPGARGDNMICGVCFGDVNRDGLPDVVIGQHFEKPWQQPVANRLYLHRGLRDGAPVFEDVTEAAGLVPLPMKAPHVEIQDFDNDGWPDISTSLVKLREKEVFPVIFRHLGLEKGLPRFTQGALAVNDFPSAEDRAVQRTGELFAKMIRDGKVTYSAAAPSGDYDNDGRLDLFLPSWWPEARSLLLHNETPGGHWLQVAVEGTDGINRMGVGARVNIYPAGKGGEPAALLGCREIAVGFGYASGQPAVAHLGLGAETAVDVEVVLPHGRGRIVQKNVPADQRLRIVAKPTEAR